MNLMNQQNIETLTAHLPEHQAKVVSDIYDETVLRINYREYSKEDCLAMVNALAAVLKVDVEVMING